MEVWNCEGRVQTRKLVHGLYINCEGRLCGHVPSLTAVVEDDGASNSAWRDRAEASEVTRPRVMAGPGGSGTVPHFPQALAVNAGSWPKRGTSVGPERSLSTNVWAYVLILTT